MLDDIGNFLETDEFVDSTPGSLETAGFERQGGSNNVEDDLVPLSPKELYDVACGRCFMCQKEDCGLCYTCERNQTFTRRYKEVCLRKVLNASHSGVVASHALNPFCFIAHRCAMMSRY